MSESLDLLRETLYAELRDLAARQLGRGRMPGVLDPTDLVHEAWIKLSQASGLYGVDQPRFLGLAARVLRQVLVDQAREQRAHKRGGNWGRVTLHDAHDVGEAPHLDILALHEALNRLAELSPRQAQVVELRYFTGLGIDETAEVLGVSPRTVNGEWKVARVWLKRELS